MRGKTVSDIESGKIYLALELLNVGEKPIVGVGIQIFFFEEKSNVPVAKPEYYFDLKEIPPEAFVADIKPEKHRSVAENNVLFGNDYFIELTDNYFKRIDIGVTSVTFADGTSEKYAAVSRSEYNTFNSLDKEKKTAYDDINIYGSLEERYPARFIPTKDEMTWVCCCGAKNPIAEEKCAVCKRERDWQFENLTVQNLEKVADDYNNSEQAARMRAGELRAQAFSNSNYNVKEREEQERRAREGMERAQQQQKQAEVRRKRIITIAFVWILILAAYLVYSKMTGRL